MGQCYRVFIQQGLKEKQSAVICLSNYDRQSMQADREDEARLGAVADIVVPNKRNIILNGYRMPPLDSYSVSTVVPILNQHYSNCTGFQYISELYTKSQL